jgi:hypothetical protein
MASNNLDLSFKSTSMFAKKIIYLSSNLRGTAQYWAQKAKELRSLVQFNINEGNGLPSYFCTGS